MHIDDTVTFGDLSISAGYIQSSEKGGMGGLLNNFYDPFAEDTIEEYLNVRAWYISSTYAFNEKTALTLTYGDKYADFDDEGSLITGEKISEFDVIISHNFTERLGGEFAFINYDSKQSDSWSRFYANLVYSF